MLLAQKEGIRCAAMKVVMLSPFPVRPVLRFYKDCQQILVPELNYSGQFAKLLSSEIVLPVTRISHTTGAPLDVNILLETIRRAARKHRRHHNAA
jgi:2-oxoglutarate ferredoxin oxidoreductase subunit alpha